MAEMTIPELMEGKTITTFRMEGADMYLHLGNDEYVIIMSPVMYGGNPMISIMAHPLEGKVLQ